MPKEKLNLLKFAARKVAQAHAGAAQVVWGQFLDASANRQKPRSVPTRNANERLAASLISSVICAGKIDNCQQKAEKQLKRLFWAN